MQLPVDEAKADEGAGAGEGRVEREVGVALATCTVNWLKSFLMKLPTKRSETRQTQCAANLHV